MDQTVREELWTKVIEAANKWPVPWIVGGDFNTIRCLHENFNGSNLKPACEGYQRLSRIVH